MNANETQQVDAFRVCTRTADAYSRSFFTSPGWFRIGENLAKRGFSEAEIECILRSKWMRWTCDASDNGWGRVNSADFERAFGAETASPEIFRATSLGEEMLTNLSE